MGDGKKTKLYENLNNLLEIMAMTKYYPVPPTWLPLCHSFLSPASLPNGKPCIQHVSMITMAPDGTASSYDWFSLDVGGSCWINQSCQD